MDSFYNRALAQIYSGQMQTMHSAPQKANVFEPSQRRAQTMQRSFRQPSQKAASDENMERLAPFMVRSGTGKNLMGQQSGKRLATEYKASEDELDLADMRKNIKNMRRDMRSQKDGRGRQVPEGWDAIQKQMDESDEFII